MIAEQSAAPPLKPDLRVGFLLMNHFTLISVAGLVESLRFAADESFSSRQIFCQWDWMTCDNQPVTASCGMKVSPTAPLNLELNWDYLVLAGGLLEETRNPPAWLLDALRQIHARKIPIITLCSGAFILGNAGLLNGRQCAIHFTTRDEFRQRFPQVTTVIDKSYINDRGIITCPGGTAIDLAADLIRWHCGEIRAQKGLKYLLVDEESGRKTAKKNREAKASQDVYENDLVLRAIGFMKHHLDSPVALTEVAEFIGVNTRQLNRAFILGTSETASAYWRKLRLDHARKLMSNSSYSINAIASASGFADASHLITWFRKQYGETPSAYRKRRRDVERLLKS
ncbi:helix-turn-helix domain-containing protein [Erwiniaceae bacterium BAC15a-03b]|uniref:Helix-turn-helix domain-containing protein n=1 Tax=Winslowiella arboricola TaxID=2978220 RepID=A0A9J6PXU4_9GAMM|nr:helix-turn-helix domain-containing protein [Winslowiella arboricola]MCU5775315.1 helix-turn-helix domain-containing protein [Winslowiella arboricola]MCU5780288.1 helix-turn-helix domain-containing protein [Winslowiella arboricola]